MRVSNGSKHRVHMCRLMASLIAVTGLTASEHHGTVESGGSPIPGATVTAVRGDKKFVTNTDEKGAYAFADLPDGIWTIHVETMGFSELSREVAIAPDAPSPTWQLKLLTLDAVRKELTPHSASEEAVKPAQPPPAQPTTGSATADRTGGNTGTRGGSAKINRPSSTRQAGDPGGFQRLDVSRTAESAALDGNGETPAMNNADPAQSSDALL